MKIEVCINRLEDVRKVQDLAIDRIELCVELGCGGLTPSLAMVEQAMKISSVPIHVLVRPRSGDFIYSELVIEEMKTTINHLRQLEVTGIVIGALNNANALPLTVLSSFRNLFDKGLLYFHRAFDVVKNPDQALMGLIELGYDGILTSGQQETAFTGINQLNQWKQKAMDQLTILPGGGINASNCLAFKELGFNWIHLSSTRRILPEKKTLFSAPSYVLDTVALGKVVSIVKA